MKEKGERCETKISLTAKDFETHATGRQLREKTGVTGSTSFFAPDENNAVTHLGGLNREIKIRCMPVCSVYTISQQLHPIHSEAQLS